MSSPIQRPPLRVGTHLPMQLSRKIRGNTQHTHESRLNEIPSKETDCSNKTGAIHCSSHHAHVHIWWSCAVKRARDSLTSAAATWTRPRSPSPAVCYRVRKPQPLQGQITMHCCCCVRYVSPVQPQNQSTPAAEVHWSEQTLVC